MLNEVMDFKLNKCICVDKQTSTHDHLDGELEFYFHKQLATTASNECRSKNQ